MLLGEAKHVFKALKVEWRNLDSVTGANSLRSEIVECSLSGFIDYLAVICFILSIPAIWRWNYLFPEFKNIVKTPTDELKVQGTKHQKQLINKFTFFNDLAFTAILTIIRDVLYLPVVVLMAPSYILAYWRLIQLTRCLKATAASDFSAHRALVFKLGTLGAKDMLKIMLIILVYLTLYRIPTLHVTRKLYRSSSSPRTDTSRETNKPSSSQLNMDLESDFKEKPISRATIKSALHCLYLLCIDVLSISFCFSCILSANLSE